MELTKEDEKMMAEEAALETALAAANNPALKQEAQVFLLWSDGEITMEKGGDLLGLRNRHQMRRPIFSPSGLGKSIRSKFVSKELDQRIDANLAELEISALQTQCLNRRLPDETTVARDAAAWAAARNAARRTITWSFTLEEARTTLQRLYPIRE